MSWTYFGLIDIIIIVGAIVMLILGYKKGFLKKALSLVGVLAIFIFAVFAASSFAGFLENSNIIYPALQSKFETSIVEASGGATTANEALQYALGIGEGFSDFILRIIGVDAESNFASVISVAAARFIMVPIAFGILLVGGLLILLILKIIVSVVRKNQFIKVVDGILGMGLYLTIYAVSIALLFTILYVVVDGWHLLPDNAEAWIHTDFKIVVNVVGDKNVLDHSHMTLSGVLYTSNPFMVILRLFGLR